MKRKISRQISPEEILRFLKKQPGIAPTMYHVVHELGVQLSDISSSICDLLASGLIEFSYEKRVSGPDYLMFIKARDVNDVFLEHQEDGIQTRHRSSDNPASTADYPEKTR